MRGAFGPEVGRKVTLFLLAMLVVNSGPSWAADSETRTTLRVLTYNVWHGLRSGESNKRFPGEDPADKEELPSHQRTRREFMESAGKLAAYTPPVMVGLLIPGPHAIAR